MFFGLVLSSFSLFMLLFFSDLNVGSSTSSFEEEDPSARPTIPFLSITLFLSSTGYWIADVMADALVVSLWLFKSFASVTSLFLQLLAIVFGLRSIFN